jgi:hypothetical protein
VQRGFFLVDDEARLLLIGLDIPIHIDDAGRGLKMVFTASASFKRASSFGP